MAIIDAFYSAKEEDKPLLARRYHNTDVCTIGQEIPEDERVEGNVNKASERIGWTQRKRSADIAAGKGNVFEQD